LTTENTLKFVNIVEILLIAQQIRWADCVRNKKVLLRVKKASNILHTVTRSKADQIGHILPRNCLLKYVIEG
jgi:hypothetical protein